MARSKAISEIFRVPFSMYVFFLGYLIYRLVCLSQDINQERDTFKTDIMEVCITTQNATNYVLGLQNKVVTGSIEAIANITNEASNVAVGSLKSVVRLGSKLFVLFLRYATSSYRCVTIAGLQMATDVFIDNQAKIETFADDSFQDIENGIVETFAAATNAINNITSYINTYLNTFDSVQASLNQYDIHLGAPSVSIPAIPLLQIPEVVFENTTSWTAPDYTTIYNSLVNEINPMNYALSALDNITNFGNVSAAVLEQELGVSNLPVYQVDFCASLNLTLFDEIVDDAIDGIYVCIGVTAFIILVLLVWNTAMVIHLHMKGQYWRPSWFAHGGTLEKFLVHVWHKPSMTCLLIGILGIAIFKGLELGTNDAKQGFILTVLTPVQNYTDGEIDVIGTALDQFSLNFANAINTQINSTLAVYLNIRDELNGTVSNLVGVQAQANSKLNNSLENANEDTGPVLDSMVQCLFPLLTIPLTDLYNLIPAINNFPLVGDRDLTFNRTKAKLLVSTALNKTTYPFDWFYAKLEQEVRFYYYLTAYGTPVFLIGLIFASRDLYKNRQQHPKVVVTEANDKQFRV